MREQVAADGSLPIPTSLSEAAWWGAGIGSDGAMVLSGHINWGGATGPFEELWRTRRGDVVTVFDGDSRKFTYRVSEVITLDKDELPKQAGELFSQSGPNRLVLVTCGGRWVGGNQGYEDNRIVVAVPA